MGSGDPSRGAVAPGTAEDAPAAEPPAPAPIRGGPLVAALALFFVSGAVGLAYEVAWTRRLLLLLGSTSVASALVLSVFLGGLGIGARRLGPLADRVRRPLALYGVLEILAALWAAGVPPLVAALEGPFATIAAHAGGPVRMGLRFLVAALVVAPGAFLLGGTFPALLRAFIRREGVAAGPSPSTRRTRSGPWAAPSSRASSAGTSSAWQGDPVAAAAAALVGVGPRARLPAGTAGRCGRAGDLAAADRCRA
jgi:spermidine synthase